MSWFDRALRVADALLFVLLGSCAILAAIDRVWPVVVWCGASAGLAAYRFLTEGVSQ